MSLSNREIAQIFDNIADMLEIQGESRFRFLSYRRAAETIGDLQRELQSYADAGELEDIPGVGKAISDKIREMLDTGNLDFYEKLKDKVPLGILEIKAINGVGPKKAKLFWDELNITSVEALKEAAEADRLSTLSGMGKKSQQKILDGIESLERRSGRTPIGDAKPAAERILAHLMELDVVEDGCIAGSIRRGKPTIGDVDILIASDDANPIMEKFVNMDGIARVLGHGPTKSSIELHSGLQVDVRVLPKQRWGTALQYFSGSQQHNIRVREIAKEHGYSLNEDALRPIDDDGNLIADESGYVYCGTEEAVYEKIGLQWVPPEMREDAGEIELAKNSNLPKLITIEDIQADLHMHTTYSDGKLSIEEMANAAKRRGMKYIVITDHSKSSYQAGGLSAEDLLAQREAVKAVDAEIDDIHILHGVEMDILTDGTMDYDDEVIKQLDFVVASPHFGLQQDREQFTQRILNAINNPHVDCIGHPTGRLIGKRDAGKLDIDAAIDAAAKTGTALEINANPARLDLDAEYTRLAIQKGVLLSINTDAHSENGMDIRDYGVMTARRGWVTADHVINTWSYGKFLAWVQARG